MKFWVLYSAVCASFVSIPANAAINTASQDVLKMVQNGVSEDVIQGYVNRSPSAYNLNADDIVYLQQNGVPQPVISSMLAHDSTLAQGQPTYSQDQAQQYTQPQDYQSPQYSQQQPQNYDDNYNQPAGAQVNPPDVNAYGTTQTYADQGYYSGQTAPVMQVAPDQAPPQVASFYTALQPYGSWIYLDGYGWCWQPSVVRSDYNWQPYCDNGRWIYCDDGWYWQSGYPWGWATFHYGRWWHASCGWVWFPDTVWAPSWVCWRDYGDYCGWAPLPPSGWEGYGSPGFHFGVNIGVGLGAGLFTFIHFGDMFHGDYHHHEIPHTEVTQIYNRSRVINNVHVVNNYYARNPGISRQTVQRYTGPVHVANVRTSTADPRTSRPGVVGSGSQLAVVRPQRPPAPERTTHIVGHRLPANARSVPTTPARTTTGAHNAPNSASTSRTTSPRSTFGQPNQQLQTPRTSQTGTPHTYTPRTSENQHNNTAPSATTTTHRNSNLGAAPSTTTHRNEVGQPNQSPRVTQTAPRLTSPRTSEIPNPAPHVTEVPRPNSNPRVTEVPHQTTTPHVTQAPEVHRAYPTEAPRTPVHEPAGARPSEPTPHAVPTPHAEPAPTPHVSAPPAHVAAPPAHVSAPPAHVSAPPAHVSAPPAHVSAPPARVEAPAAHVSAPPAHVSAPPPHAAPPAHEVHGPPASPGHSESAPGHNPDRDHGH